jgi:Ni/Fe-hydrogenase subunit HybB-like protein
MNSHQHPAAPVEEKFLTPGVMVMLGLMAIGGAFIIARFIYGIGYVSNLNNQYPWGCGWRWTWPPEWPWPPADSPPA